MNRRKKSRPEQIVVGDETFERNDITAKRYGGSERTINRGDKGGAPFRFFNGVKYKTVQRYAAFFLRTIQELKPRRKRGDHARAGRRPTTTSARSKLSIVVTASAVVLRHVGLCSSMLRGLSGNMKLRASM